MFQDTLKCVKIKLKVLSDHLHLDLEKWISSSCMKYVQPHAHTQHTLVDMSRPQYGYIDMYTYFFHHTTCESTCNTLASSAANHGDNTVSVAQGGTATPGATEQLLPPDRVFKRNIYLCIHKIN